ncbi:MAG: type IV pilus biogenesis/stability protein PilW [Gammaproteobacteria bacterium]|nr:type IV pilus biogenesis/stability protein PilW [Gammaproteobacteria bacterium]MBQ0840488.1 type IV pilus biogenesis/stability protein PilW [Gammaproteobacteria bacterium]
MSQQLLIGSILAIVMVLSSACTVTEMDYSKSIGSSSASEASAKRHDEGRNKDEEAADTLIQLGLGYLRKGDRQRARVNLLKALQKNDRSGAAHNALALLFQLEGENELAEEHFKKSISLEPELTRLRFNYSIFLLRQQRYDDAFKELTIASEDINYPRRGHVFFNLGLISKQLGNADEAQQAWEKATKLSPKLAGPFLELAEMFFQAGDYPKAKRYLAHYEKLSKPTPGALWLGVRLEHAFGNKDGEASKALALKNLFPYSKETIEYKAWLKARKKGVKNLFPPIKDTFESQDILKAP